MTPHALARVIQARPVMPARQRAFPASPSGAGARCGFAAQAPAPWPYKRVNHPVSASLIGSCDPDGVRSVGSSYALRKPVPAFEGRLASYPSFIAEPLNPAFNDLKGLWEVQRVLVIPAEFGGIQAPCAVPSC